MPTGEMFNSVLMEFIKASPFGAMCIIFAAILDRSHKRQINELTNIHTQTINNIKDVYEKVYKKIDEREQENKENRKRKP